MRVNRYDEDEKNTKFSLSTYQRGLIYIKKYKFKLLAIFLLNCIAVIASLLITKMLQYLIDDIIPNGDWIKLLYIIIIATILAVINILLNRAYSKVLANVNQDIIQDIKNDLFTHIQYLSFDYYDTKPHGKILVRLTEYAEEVSSLITDKLLKTVLNIVNMLIVLLFMFTTNVELTWVSIIGVILLVILFASTAKIRRKKRLLINNKNANLNAYLLETLKGMQTTQVFNRQEKNKRIFTNLSNEWKDASCDLLKVRKYWLV